MPPLSLLIKPASGNCNLQCKYCFYHSLTEFREVESYGFMSLEDLAIIVEKALRFADRSYSVAFQGCEPTLVGLHFYKELIELQKKYNSKRVHISNAIQTNGTGIDEEWAEFLAENNFLVGISLDGPKNIHDSLWYDVNGNGSFMKVRNAIKLLNKYNVKYNVLSTVNTYVAGHVHKVYNFFKKTDSLICSFSPAWIR